MSTIHQEVRIGATPTQVYETLTEGPRFQAMSGGAPAEISPVEGASFSCFGGMIHGRTIELAAQRRVVQAWRVKSWPEGLYSLATFNLFPDGDGTKIVFDHVGFPDGQEVHLARGWDANYWEPLKKAFAT